MNKILLEQKHSKGQKIAKFLTFANDALKKYLAGIKFPEKTKAEIFADRNFREGIKENKNMIKSASLHHRS